MAAICAAERRICYERKVFIDPTLELFHRYMTDDMIHTVMDLADIKTAEFDPTRSIVNDKFNAQRPRIFDGMDYDTEIKNKR